MRGTEPWERNGASWVLGEDGREVVRLEPGQLTIGGNTAVAWSDVLALSIRVPTVSRRRSIALTILDIVLPKSSASGPTSEFEVNVQLSSRDVVWSSPATMTYDWRLNLIAAELVDAVEGECSLLGDANLVAECLALVDRIPAHARWLATWDFFGLDRHLGGAASAYRAIEQAVRDARQRSV